MGNSIFLNMAEYDWHACISIIPIQQCIAKRYSQINWLNYDYFAYIMYFCDMDDYDE